MRDLLTVSEAAARVGVHRSTVDRWITEGFLPVVRPYPGARRFVRPADIDAMFEPRLLADG